MSGVVRDPKAVIIDLAISYCACHIKKGSGLHSSFIGVYALSTLSRKACGCLRLGGFTGVRGF